MTENRNRLIFAAALIVLVAAYAFAGYAPQSRRLNAVRDEVARVDGRCAEDAAKAGTIPRMAAEVERIKREFSDFDQRLPEQTELAEFLREISSNAGAESLRRQVIKPGNPSTGALYNRLPILMDFQCTFGELVNYLEKMKQMTRLTRVERIRVTPVADDSEDLDVHMQVNIYFTKS